MGRTKHQPKRPSAQRPQGEQRLANAVWQQMVKAIRAMKPVTA